MEEKKTLRSAIAENPVAVLFLGACPAMAQTGSVISALGMGVAVLLVLLCSAVVIAALKKAIPGSAKLSVCVLVAAGFASLVQMLMNAFVPNVYSMLGVYLAVVAVDLVVFSGAEAAAERTVGESAKDSLLTGLGFIAALLVMALVREFLGSGSIAGFEIPFMAKLTIPVLTKAPGGFMVFAILLAVINAIRPGTAEARGLTAEAAFLCPAENNAQGE